MSDLVTVVTATTGTKYLKRNLESIQDQDYKNVRHLVYLDGKDTLPKVQELIKDMTLKNVDFIPLPYSCGENRWNGHRMYGSAIFLAREESKYITFLDEDNWVDTDHVSSLVEVSENQGFVFSMRKIVDKDGNFVCNDDCESLGLHPSVLDESDYFIDMNCYFFNRELAIQLAPIFYRKAREPGVPEIDRMLIGVLRHNNISYTSSGKYTVNYMTGNTERSVQSEFFLQGNKKMLDKYNGELPWTK